MDAGGKCIKSLDELVSAGSAEPAPEGRHHSTGIVSVCVHLLELLEQKDLGVWKGCVLGRSQGLAWFRLCPEQAALLCTGCLTGSQGFAASLVTQLSWEAPAKKQHVGTSVIRPLPLLVLPCPSVWW